MNSETIFQMIAFLLLTSALCISVYHRHRAEQEGGQQDRAAGQHLLIGLRLFGMIVILPLLGYFVNPAWVAWARVPLPDWMRWSGVVIAIPMLACIYWLFRAIGTNISPTHTTRTHHRLVTTGPYRWIRHPLYTFGLIFFLALGLITGLWWLVAGMLVAFVVLAWRTPHEEAHLLAKFGDEYSAYMQHTGRYLPRLF